jgi:hypothetical protein
VKYYLYVSDAKVDMLYAQIPQSLLDRLSAELKIDLKVVSLTIRPDAEPRTRYAKLRLVVEYLKRAEPFGWLVTPETYFQDTLPLTWGIVGSTAVFVARRGSTLLGLTGSRHHLTGKGGAQGEFALDSFSHMIMPSLAASLVTIEEEKDPRFLELDPRSALAFVATHLKGSGQSLEFVARTLLHEDVSGHEWGPAYRETTRGVTHVLFASPLYVAMPS